MQGQRRGPAFATDEWLLEQELRAEMEAEAWRRLRQRVAIAAPPEPAPLPGPAPAAAPTFDPHKTGSTMLKALVRFGLGAFAGYLAFLAGVDSGLGEFEIWLAIGAAFLVTLALSAFGPLQRFVHLLAETARWAIIVAVCFGALYVMLNPQSFAG